ncbi:DUF4265 domain-containing protein [Pseudomonas entomophila]|uniref:DUF4265 domain-containing protein n=1 Tax=Pseudomonas entomophila TaxID=312306 RepID=UPI001F00CAE0|nr:DUF4265 domain-containing protein [Pseudomonas entomophila]MCG8296308.1 DUF4265 domain-containing protein [Pseudomonas entomophila]
MEKVEAFSVIKVFVSARGPVYEELPALWKGEGVYELLSSPGLALNLAKGDLISIEDPNAPAVVIKRGGNFCINLYADHIDADTLSTLESQVNVLLNGTLDGVYRGNLAFSVPARSGKENIREVFNRFKEATGIEWYYSNIYKNYSDLDDETLLNWWLDS